ncbi:MAG: AIR synthase related protein, partial [Bacteroidia bacterium]|nr:AIR synthase related protein [Bacteroidia bacterium]
VTDTGLLEYWWKGDKVAELPPSVLMSGEGAPVYDWPRTPPATFEKNLTSDLSAIPDATSPARFLSALETLLQHPNIADKSWIYTQYDHMVGACTIGTASGMRAAVPLLRIPYTDRALAMTLDCNPWWVEAHPRIGTALAVAEAARQVACTGAVPLGVTNCLNFGSPLVPEVYWQFVEAVEGLREACELLELPVTGGNVSFYNQDENGPILPTPVVGVVGLLEKALERFVPIGLPSRPALLYLVTDDEGLQNPSLGSSHYLREICGIRQSAPPRLSLSTERKLILLLPRLAQKGLLCAAQDVSDGGIVIALLEMAFHGAAGFRVQSPPGVRIDAFWFGEDGGRVILAIPPIYRAEVETEIGEAGLRFYLLGETLPHLAWGEIQLPEGRVELDLIRLKGLWASALQKSFPSP